MNTVYGLYRTPHAAERAFDGLRSLGISPRSISVVSSEPFEEWAFGKQERETVMSWIAVLGAGFGLAGGYLLTSLTQQAWPINTGGMPIVSNWTNIIILFEMTMLGAVLATVVTFLVTARLPSPLPPLYDSAVAGGRILVGVAGAQESQCSAIESALRAAGPETLKSVAHRSS